MVLEIENLDLLLEKKKIVLKHVAVLTCQQNHGFKEALLKHCCLLFVFPMALAEDKKINT